MMYVVSREMRPYSLDAYDRVVRDRELLIMDVKTCKVSSMLYSEAKQLAIDGKLFGINTKIDALYQPYIPKLYHNCYSIEDDGIRCGLGYCVKKYELSRGWQLCDKDGKEAVIIYYSCEHFAPEIQFAYAEKIQDMLKIWLRIVFFKTNKMGINPVIYLKCLFYGDKLICIYGDKWFDDCLDLAYYVRDEYRPDKSLLARLSLTEVI